jgi:hypothetical protein
LGAVLEVGSSVALVAFGAWMIAAPAV